MLEWCNLAQQLNHEEGKLETGDFIQMDFLDLVQLFFLDKR